MYTQTSLSDSSESEIDETQEHYKLLKDLIPKKISSGSCNINEINNIIFGGTTSRFWMMRKHINMMDSDQLKDLPFFSWECLTIQLDHRDIDLVIRNEEHMDALLRYLIYNMNTIDGVRDSAKGVLEVLD